MTRTLYAALGLSAGVLLCFLGGADEVPPFTTEPCPPCDPYVIIYSDELWELEQRVLLLLDGARPTTDVNTAEPAQLAELPRSLLGEELAQTLAELRMEEQFTSWEDLRRRAAGIGSRTIAAMRSGGAQIAGE